jgi:hypothetical protein
MKILTCRYGHPATKSQHECEYGYECNICDECQFKFELSETPIEEVQNIELETNLIILK